MSKTRISRTRNGGKKTRKQSPKNKRVRQINKQISQIIKSLTSINSELAMFGGKLQSGGGNVVLDIGRLLVNRFVGSSESDKSSTDSAQMPQVAQIPQMPQMAQMAEMAKKTISNKVTDVMSDSNKAKKNYVKNNWDKIQKLNPGYRKQPIDDDFSKKTWIYRLNDNTEPFSKLKHGVDYLVDSDEFLQHVIQKAEAAEESVENTKFISDMKELLKTSTGETVDDNTVEDGDEPGETEKTVENANVEDSEKTVEGAQAQVNANVEETENVETENVVAVDDINTYPVETLNDAIMQLMSRVMNGSGIVFSKLLGQGFLLTLGLLTGSQDEVEKLLNQPEALDTNDIISSTSKLKTKLGRASEIVGAMATNQHIQNLLSELTDKVALFLMKIKVPVIEISGIVIKSVVQIIQENSAIMGKGVAKTLWGFINTIVGQIPVIGVLWSMMIFVSTAFIYAIQFMNVVTSKGAQGAINAAQIIKRNKTVNNMKVARGGGLAGNTVGKLAGNTVGNVQDGGHMGGGLGGEEFAEINNLFMKLTSSIGEIVNTCGK